MVQDQFVPAKQLSTLAKRFRKRAGKTRAEAAREMNVSQPSIFQAEERNDQSVLKLRVRMIEAYSRYAVVGPLFRLRRDNREEVNGKS
jgi:DNA-binding XRE family transcriptional regulator